MGCRSPSIFFFFQAEDGIRDADTGVQTCALPISHRTVSGVVGASRGGLRGLSVPGGRTQIARAVLEEGNSGRGRSEERRVGKECRGRGSGSVGKKKVRRLCWGVLGRYISQTGWHS